MSDMSIARIEALPVSLPEGDSFGGHGTLAGGRSHYAVQAGWKGVYSPRIETLLVRIETDNGLVGWGEGQSPIAPEVAGTIVQSVIAPLLVGRDPMPAKVLWDEMYGLMNVRGHTGGFMLDAIAAVDMALWDIKGKAIGVPVSSLLGGPARVAVPCYVSGVRGNSDAERLADLRSFTARGFTSFKVFGGFGVEADLRMLEALRPEANQLALDSLWNYSRIDALRLGRSLQQLGCAWFEAPVDPEDIAGHAELARVLDLPVAGGETQRTRRELRSWFEQAALDIVQPDIGRCGITEGERIVDQAELHNLTVTLHCGIASPVMIAASLQVAAARSAVAMMEYQPVVVAAANRLLAEPLRVENGLFQVPPGPGLGIELDEEPLRRLSSQA